MEKISNNQIILNFFKYNGKNLPKFKKIWIQFLKLMVKEENRKIIWQCSDTKIAFWIQTNEMLNVKSWYLIE